MVDMNLIIILDLYHKFDIVNDIELHSYYAPPQKVAGYYVIPSELLSVCPSVCPSVRPSVRLSARPSVSG